MSADGNLLAYYTLEDALDDIASFDLTNTGTTAFVPAKFNNGADFTTINSGKKLEIANNLGLTGNAFSFVMWVYLNDTPTSGNIIEFVNHNGINGTDNEGIRYFNNGGTLQIQFHRVKNGVSDESLNVNHTLTEGNLIHLGHTWDGSTMRGYVSGSEIGNKSSSGNGSSGIGSKFNISKDDASGGGFIADDVGVFSRAITPTEMLELGGPESSDFIPKVMMF